MNIQAIKYDSNGLVPAIVQDEATGTVLMLAYMNAESLRKTLEAGVTWFYSRACRTLWQKGRHPVMSRQSKKCIMTVMPIPC